MKKNDKNYLVVFTLKDVENNVINFATGGAPTFTTSDITTTNTADGDVEVKVLGKGPRGTVKSTPVTSADCTVTLGLIFTTVTGSTVFTNEAGDWQLQVQINKQTATGNDIYLSDPVTITVWEALS